MLSESPGSSVNDFPNKNITKNRHFGTSIAHLLAGSSRKCHLEDLLRQNRVSGPSPETLLRLQWLSAFLKLRENAFWAKSASVTLTDDFRSGRGKKVIGTSFSGKGALGQKKV